MKLTMDITKQPGFLYTVMLLSISKQIREEAERQGNKRLMALKDKNYTIKNIARLAERLNCQWEITLK